MCMQTIFLCFAVFLLRQEMGGGGLKGWFGNDSQEYC